MAIPPILWILGAAGLAAAASTDSNGTNANDPPFKTPQRRGTIKGLAPTGQGPLQGGWPFPWPRPPGASNPELRTGPLPIRALAAWSAPKSGRGRKRSAYGPKNDIHARGGWIRFATYSDNWDKKLEKMRIYADPPGVFYIKSESKVRNLCWMMQAPRSWYPGYGRAARRNVRCDAIDQWLGPKADWNTVKGLVKDSIAAIPSILQAGGVVGAAYATGGASVTEGTGDQVEVVTDAIKAGLEPIGNTGESVSKRKAAAKVVYYALADAYIARVMAANPHAVRGGKLDIGKNYKDDPKTWEDLRARGKARPLLWVP